MPSRIESPHWFEECFGFKEGPYGETHGKFTFADGVLTSNVTGASFHVGPFHTPSVAELHESLTATGGLAVKDCGGLSFRNICGDAKQLHLDARNAGAVLQVASQFNCLEMNEPGARPEDGVTRYCNDATQGPACALACPAGTVFRNYFVNEGSGQAGKRQLDCLADVGELLENGKERYWRMVNGYSLPDAPGGLAKLADRLQKDEVLKDKVRSALRVGVHWETEVKGGSHRVCQVFSSAVPVAYAKGVRSDAWAPLASAVLDGTFEATLVVATVLAQQRQQRVKVFLTGVGGGAFGNRSMWITQAIERSLKLFADAPLDVRLVSFGTLPKGAYKDLEKGRRDPRPAPAGPAPGAAGSGASAAEEPLSEPGEPDGAGPSDVEEASVDSDCAPEGGAA